MSVFNNSPVIGGSADVLASSKIPPVIGMAVFNNLPVI
jgi:hypothetical protein